MKKCHVFLFDSELVLVHVAVVDKLLQNVRLADTAFKPVDVPRSNGVEEVVDVESQVTCSNYRIAGVIVRDDSDEFVAGFYLPPSVHPGGDFRGVRIGVAPELVDSPDWEELLKIYVEQFVHRWLHTDWEEVRRNLKK